MIALDNARAISGGAYQSFAILESGAARSWGYNGSGEIGNGASGLGADSDVPVRVKNLTDVRNVSGGYEFTLAATQ